MGTTSRSRCPRAVPCPGGGLHLPRDALRALVVAALHALVQGAARQELLRARAPTASCSAVPGDIAPTACMAIGT
eukprot:7083784-Pyramimonas_sp.AAC.1